MENIFSLAFRCLIETNVDEKIIQSNNIFEKIKLNLVDYKACVLDVDTIKPGRPVKPELINAKDVPRRSTYTKEGRAAMVHSFAHIEFNAINLAWDLVCRFQDMPKEFYKDWAQVAAEETKHFKMLREHLNKIDYDYGSFPAHDGLWTIAEQTSHDILLRLAVVPRIMEARGLDVTPDLIERFRQVKDDSMVSILELIFEEEIGHVMFGSKWYRFICKDIGKDPEETFREIMRDYLPSTKNKKINHEARLKAGFSQNELDFIMEV